jgi:ceramide glucosyltransferase
MFRRSHLNYLTSNSSHYSPGVDFFSQNICEDHLIGDLLWRKKVPEEEAGEKWGKHALVFGDLAIQPMARMSVQEYIARRVRWLRVRKWTVTVATLIEPGTECFLCSAYGSFALITLPWFHDALYVPQTWSAFTVIWLLNVLAWVTVDYFVYAKLHSCASVEINANTPSFARPPAIQSRRSLKEWIVSWFGREILALPIWIWAVWGGTTVVWRSKKFWVGMDMKVHEVEDQKRNVVINATEKGENGSVKSKIRRD